MISEAKAKATDEDRLNYIFNALSYRPPDVEEVEELLKELFEVSDDEENEEGEDEDEEDGDGDGDGEDVEESNGEEEGGDRPQDVDEDEDESENGSDNEAASDMSVLKHAHPPDIELT